MTTEDLIAKLGYPGIILLLVAGGLGLPLPEEAPIIVAAVLSKKQAMSLPLALAACLVGVMAGDFVVYFLGYFYGERVLSFRLTRKFLTKAREEQMKGYFHRHGVKILILGRFAVGFRTAAYLTAGILRLPTLRLFLTDLCAATISTLLIFGLGYAFAHHIEVAMQEVQHVQHWLIAILGLALGGWLLYRYYRAWRRAGLPVGPPVLPEDVELPLPPDDLHPSGSFPTLAAPIPPPPAAAAPLKSSSGVRESGLAQEPASGPGAASSAGAGTGGPGSNQG